MLPGAEPGVAPWRLDAGVELPVRLGHVMLGRFVLVAADTDERRGLPARGAAETPSASPNAPRPVVVVKPARRPRLTRRRPFGLESKLL